MEAHFATQPDGAVALFDEDRAVQHSGRRGAFARHALRGWWFVLALTSIGAAGGIVISSTSGPVYQAETLVVASNLTIPVDDFSELGPTLFTTDTVFQSIVDSLGLRTTPQGLLSQGLLSSEAIPDAVAIRITAKGSTPVDATSLANAAAQSFADTLTERQMGTFQVFQAEGASEIIDAPGESPIIGAALGFLLGVLGLLLRFWWRRPVATSEEITALLPARSFVACRVLIPLISSRKRVRNRATILPERALTAIREIASQPRTETSASSGQIASQEESHHALITHASRPTSCFIVFQGTRAGHMAIEALLSRLGVQNNESSYLSASSTRMASIHARASGLGHAMSESQFLIAVVARDCRRRDVDAVLEELLVSRRDLFQLIVWVRPRRVFRVRSSKSPRSRERSPDELPVTSDPNPSP